MVANQPRLEEVLPRLVRFVGELPVVGHNIKFDLSFLRPKRALRHNESLDTFDLASVMLTSAPRYSLAALANALNIPHPTPHRAGHDARAEHGVFIRLFQQACQLPLEVLAEIVRHGQGVEWGGAWIFEEALALRSREKAGPRRIMGEEWGPLFQETRERRRSLRTLTPSDTRRPIDAEGLGGLLVPGGPLSQHFPGYEHRPQQIEMLTAVAEAFNRGHHMLVEAGTGTGKSLAYLIPAAEWARQNGERVVVSTNTINLQEQLIQKDIPDLQAALGLEFKAAVLKGRANYLCPRRFESLRRRGPQSPEDMRLLAKVLVWHSNGGASGDRGDLTLTGPGAQAAWRRISAEDDQCTLDTCYEKSGGACPFYKARRAAEEAHLVIINHALLMADIAAGNQVLPEYRYLVVDEAHHLEAAATDGLSFETDRNDVETRLKELGGPNAGLLGTVLTACRGALALMEFAQLEAEAGHAHSGGVIALALSKRFFDAVSAFLEEQREGRPLSEFGQQVRVIAAVRNQPAWEQVEAEWGELRGTLRLLADRLARMAVGLSDVDGDGIPDRDELVSSLNSVTRFFEDLLANVEGLVTKPADGTVYWCQANSDGQRMSLHAAPLHVGPLVEKHLWHTKESVVMTSATLTVGGEFEYLKGRLNADEAGELAVGSPFDYQFSTLLYLVEDVPEPKEGPAFQRALEAALEPLLIATQGRALVLFTAYQQLKQTSQALTEPLARAGILVYEHGTGASRSALLEGFKSAQRAVLLGTKSFWEGVDVPGEGLSLLVIVKLPFDVPTEPIVAARAETFERPFDEYSLPEAVLRFRQGFGRLIRTKTDRGVVAVFDRRIVSKFYGRAFRESLPSCTVMRGPALTLPETARRWIAERGDFDGSARRRV